MSRLSTRLITDEVMFVDFSSVYFFPFFSYSTLGSKSLRVVQASGTEGPGEWGIKFQLLLEEVVSINIPLISL